MDGNSVYGMALLTAHDLESKVAVNPIVVLCDNTMKLVDKHIGYYSGEAAPQVRDVLKGPDGRYFLNYLTECIIEGDDREYLDAKSLRRHKKQVESALKAYASIPTVFSKFAWLAEYHNYFCDTVSGYPEYNEAMKVSATICAVQFQRITKKSRPSITDPAGCMPRHPVISCVSWGLAFHEIQADAACSPALCSNSASGSTVR